MFFFKERFQKKKKSFLQKIHGFKQRFSKLLPRKKKKKIQNLTKKYFLRKECFSKILMLIL